MIMNNTKVWIDIMSALLVPFIAIVGAVIALLQWRTNELKRKQDLFDRRYDFYQRLRDAYIAASQLSSSLDDTAFFELSEEASLLFGREVEQHILKISDQNISEHVRYGILLDDWLIQPFRKYLKLK